MIKFLARDAETGRIGTFQAGFVVPNLNRDRSGSDQFRSLGSQRVDIKRRCTTPRRTKIRRRQRNWPIRLLLSGQKIIPSVTRVFNSGRTCLSTCQAYKPTATTAEPLVAYVTFYRGQTKAFETPPLAVTEAWDNRLKTVRSVSAFLFRSFLPASTTVRSPC